MTTINGITRSVAFFFEHAGYSYPVDEQSREGRTLYRVIGAETLAEAERQAREQGYTFEWQLDDLDSSEWDKRKPAYEQWACLMYDAEHKVVQSLGGIDFGRDSPEPWGKPYKRVVEAELALEHFGESEPAT